MKRILTVACHRPEPYEAALRAAGLEPVYDQPLDAVDALMLQGGTDVDPDLYGEEPAPETDEPDRARDVHELWLIADALRRDMPILAICRGMQILNVAHGGTLIQHIEGHRIAPGDQGHPVKVAPGTRLAGIFGAGTEVNSRHHQAVGRVGGGLIVSARANDRIIEGVERPDKPFVVGVQWHPEDIHQPELFAAFAAASAGARSLAT